MIEKAQPKKPTHAPAPAAKNPLARTAPAAAKPIVLSPETKMKLDGVCHALDNLMEDTSVPRNIRRGAEEAKKVLLTDTIALDVRKSKAIGILDELANDPNIPLHGRTLIWSIMSQLEPLA